jgi:hypothetical protein
MRTGHEREARARFAAALRTNPYFDPFEADDARAQLARLDKETAPR